MKFYRLAKAALLSVCLFGSGLAGINQAAAAAGGAGAAAQSQSGAADGYNLQPPPLSVPAGEAGAVRRSVMQFYHWTLLCDEILADKKQICNVTQTVRDGAGETIFSWSLAAADDGTPFMLLRAPAAADANAPVRLALPQTKQSVTVAFSGCNESVCLAQTPVGPILTKAITQQAEVQISYKTAAGLVQFGTSFKGLKQALASLR